MAASAVAKRSETMRTVTDEGAAIIAELAAMASGWGSNPGYWKNC
jgi:hypothetical protein